MENKKDIEREVMTKNVPGDICPKCGAIEIDAMTPRTVYACGSSDFDQRPKTFIQSEQCENYYNETYGKKISND